MSERCSNPPPWTAGSRSGDDRRLDAVLAEHHRAVEHRVRGDRVGLVHRHLQRRARWLRPLPAAVDLRRIRRVRRVVLVHRAAEDLPRVPVGVEQRRVRDDDVLADALDFLRVPERERVVVADGDEHAVRLDGVQQVVREVARVRVAARARPCSSW